MRNKRTNLSIFSLIAVLGLGAFFCLNQKNTQNILQLQEQDMIWVQGGETKIGFEQGQDNEKPVFYQYINSFWIDKSPITVGQFKKFIKLTRYVTDAEKQEKGYFLDSLTQILVPIPRASWLYPWGREKPQAIDSQIVTQISWNDAKAYATWLGKRLPTEFEWELLLQNQKKYAVQFPSHHTTLWFWSENFFRMYQETGYRKHRLNETKTLKGGKIWDAQAQKYLQRPSLRLHFSPEVSCANFSFFCAKDAEK
ncbi:MAG: formylglycine-generating enzyme family protein [Microscillaceae bacterium]|nr:formylglycine-generating enzyme family protein [Microscillaceae bacterium]MDW8460793.1 SUMF1/EgtB/PvdO family nonheme iron enzyme [Cytophagales bacterium]